MPHTTGLLSSPKAVLIRMISFSNNIYLCYFFTSDKHKERINSCWMLHKVLHKHIYVMKYCFNHFPLILQSPDPHDARWRCETSWNGLPYCNWKWISDWFQQVRNVLFQNSNSCPKIYPCFISNNRCLRPKTFELYIITSILNYLHGFCSWFCKFM